MAVWRWYIVFSDGRVMGWSRSEEAATARLPTGGQIIHASSRAMVQRILAKKPA